MIDSYNKDYSKKRGIFGLLIKTPEFNDQNVNFFKYIKSIYNYLLSLRSHRHLKMTWLF